MKIQRRQLQVLSLLLIAIAVASAYLAINPLTSPATGAAVSSLKLVPYKIEGDRFSNFDFEEELYSAEHVDWPIDLIFAHGATIGNVKDKLNPPFFFGRHKFLGHDVGASPQYLLLDAGFGRIWDEDSGRKTSPCQLNNNPNVYHYRVYAPPDRPVDHFFNRKWGAFVVASSHVDHNECDFGPFELYGDKKTWFGENEDAEGEVWSAMAFQNPSVHWWRNRVPLGNHQNLIQTDLVHRFRNNGAATFFSFGGR
jgi:hypothetical protein